MPASEQLVLVDGSVDFSGGVDSVKVTTIQSDVNPGGLARNQLAWLVNAGLRDGGITQRATFQPIGFMHEPDGLKGCALGDATVSQPCVHQPGELIASQSSWVDIRLNGGDFDAVYAARKIDRTIHQHELFAGWHIKERRMFRQLSGRWPFLPEIHPATSRQSRQFRQRDAW